MAIDQPAVLTSLFSFCLLLWSPGKSLISITQSPEDTAVTEVNVGLVGDNVGDREGAPGDDIVL